MKRHKITLNPLIRVYLLGKAYSGSIISNCMFILRTQSQNGMEQYAEIIGKDASSEDYTKIATYFENAGDHFKAGSFFLSAKKYDKVGVCPYSIDVAF